MTGQPTEATRIVTDVTAIVDRLVPFASDVSTEALQVMYAVTVDLLAELIHEPKTTVVRFMQMGEMDHLDEPQRTVSHLLQVGEMAHLDEPKRTVSDLLQMRDSGHLTDDPRPSTK